MAQLDPDLIDVDIQIRRPTDGGIDVLREFTAGIGYCGADGEEELGIVMGWIGWSVSDEDLAEAGDAISFDAAQLGAVAADIVATHPGHFVDAALLIDRMHIEPKWRGSRLSGPVISSLLELLRLEPDSTVVVLEPEPQQPSGGPYDYGPARDEAMAHLHSAYRESGLEPWRESTVWWSPF